MIQNKSNLILGIDVGGSKINIIIWNGKKVLNNWQTEDVSVEKLKEGISRFKISKIGIGMAGILDHKTGHILNSPNLKSFEGFCLKDLKKNIRFDNDVNCFLRAEAKLGAAGGYKNVLAVAMGTGIGGAYLESHGSAGEFGFMVLEDRKTWEQLYQETKDNPEKQEQIHAIGFANLINAFDPEIIILGGGGAKLPNRKLMEEFIVSPLSKKTKIVFGKLGPDANAIGAALLWNK